MQYSVTPCHGHLKAIQCIFGYRKLHPNGMIVIDDVTPQSCNSVQLHHKYGKPIKIIVFVDADYAQNIIQPGLLSFLDSINNNQIYTEFNFYYQNHSD